MLCYNIKYMQSALALASISNYIQHIYCCGRAQVLNHYCLVLVLMCRKIHSAIISKLNFLVFAFPPETYWVLFLDF